MDIGATYAVASTKVAPGIRGIKMRKPASVMSLTKFGRVRLSETFFMRDFLCSEIAAIDRMPNVPDNPDLAIAAGTQLCEQVLEPLQAKFGRLAVRSSYRSSEVNGHGAAQQAAGKSGYTCASNASNAAGHIWDVLDDGRMGATACIIVPKVWDRLHHDPDGWQKLAWWIHDHLPYSGMTFYPKYWAFNIGWHEQPSRSIFSSIPPKTGYITRAGWDNNGGSHETLWLGLFD